MEKYLKVESDTSLVRDMDSNAIVSKNKTEFDKFLKLSRKKYEEKRKFDQMRGDLDSLKQDMDEIKTLLKNIMNK
jgi:hypothetical protein|tara:strand:- start:1725 stop:1949 length:225 start_codon:yes stop_codon:yes gene_type:complete